MAIKRTRLIFMLTLLLSMLLPMSVLAGEAGKFLFVFGKVELLLPDGSTALAKKGAALLEGTTIKASKSGKAQLKLIDGGFMAIRPNTTLKIDEYAYNQKGRDNKGVVSLLKGTFRTISGAIAKKNKDNVIVKTPIATIGIRGTDHEPAYFPAGGPVVPGGPAPGVYDRVNMGSTVVQSNGGQTLITAGQVGFVSSPNAAPVLLPQLPGFYKQPNVAPGVAETNEDNQQANNQQAADADAGDGAETDVEAGSDQPAEDDSTLLAEQTAENLDQGTSVVNEDDGTAVATSSITTEVEETITTTDTSGNTFDLENQTVTTVSGTTTAIVPVAPVETSETIAAVAFIQYDPNAGAGSSNIAFKMIEQSHFLDGYRTTILYDKDAHVIGGTDTDGVHQLSGVVDSSKVTGQATNFSVNGIKFGMLQASQLVEDAGSYDLGSRYWGWISGPKYQSTGLTGTLAMSKDGGLVFGGSLTGAWTQGSINSGSFTADFGAGTANMSIGASVASDNWTFTATKMPMGKEGSFKVDQATLISGTTTKVLDVKFNGGGQTFGTVSGSLTGADKGAIFSFAAKDAASVNGVSGVIAFDDGGI